jgi:amidohydrolase
MRFVLSNLLLFVLSQSFAQSKIDSEIAASISKHSGSLLQLYQHLHQHPELSQQEKQTSELKAAGYEVTQSIGGYGVAGILRNGTGPTVLIRTDMDALPIKEETGLPYASQAKAINASGNEVSVMHACGHDLHMTVFVGTARALAESKKLWKGTLILVAQPAEENGLGAEAMLNDGFYNKFPYPDYAIALHNHASLRAGTIGYSAGPFMASVDMMDITVFGKGGHGAAPHQTIDPVVLSAEMILAFQTIVSREIDPLEPAVVTVGSIHGGTVYNIIPEQVKLQLTLRSYSDDVRRLVISSIQNKARHLALQAGLPEDKLPLITYNDSAPATVNDKALTEKLVGVFRKAFGDSDVTEVRPSMIGEDFSRFARYGKPIPYAMFWLGTVDANEFQIAHRDKKELPPLHSSRFKPEPKTSITTGVRAMAIAAMTLLSK